MMLKLRFAPLVTFGLTAAIALAREPAPVAEAVKPVAVKVATAAKPAATAAVPAKPAAIRPVSAPAAKAAPVVKKSTPIAKAAPVPAATPAPKKEGFWARLFGKKPPAPTPIPATPTPKPVKKKVIKKTYKPKPRVVRTEPTDVPPDSGKVETTNAETGKPADGVTPPDNSEPVSKPPPTRSGRTKPIGEKVQNFPPSTDNAEAEAAQKQKYDSAKTKAAADPKVKELRGKADSAASEEESRKALRAYNKEMFKRMKEIEPGIKEHVERMEDAVMKRLGE